MTFPVPFLKQMIIADISVLISDGNIVFLQALHHLVYQLGWSSSVTCLIAIFPSLLY